MVCFNYFAILLLFNFVASSYQERNPDSPECQQLYLNSEQDLKELLLVDQKPKEIDEINEYCQLAKKKYGLFKKYTTQCLEPFTRTAIGVVAKSARKLINTLCNSETEKSLLFKSISCIPDNEIENWKKCAYSTNLQVDFLTHNQSVETFHSDFCCLQHLVNECINNLVIYPHCKTLESNPRVYLSRMINLLVKDVYDIVCNAYKRRESCYTHNAHRMEILRKVGKSERKVKGPLLVGPLLELLKKMTS